MGKHFDEIMRISDKGYVDSFDDIEELINKVMNIKAVDLNVKDYCQPNAFAAHLLKFNENNLPYDNVQDIRICDMLNLTYDLEDYGDYIHERYAAVIAELLRSASKTSGDIKLFLSISVKAFADFMDKKSGTSKGSELYEEIAELAQSASKITVDEKMTIKALLNGIRPCMTRWNPLLSVASFTDHAINCCAIMEKIFIGCMRVGYEEIFDFSRIEEILGIVADDELEYENMSFDDLENIFADQN